jgi:hypothetical protein
MFTIEHEFDATVITLVDEGENGQPLLEDVAIAAFAECVTITQYDPRTDRSSPYPSPSCMIWPQHLTFPKGSIGWNARVSGLCLSNLSPQLSTGRHFHGQIPVDPPILRHGIGGRQHGHRIFRQ